MTEHTEFCTCQVCIGEGDRDLIGLAVGLLTAKANGRGDIVINAAARSDDSQVTFLELTYNEPESDLPPTVIEVVTVRDGLFLYAPGNHPRIAQTYVGHRTGMNIEMLLKECKVAPLSAECAFNIGLRFGSH